MGRFAAYAALNRAELWALRALSLAAAWVALAFFVPTATPIEIVWTEVAFVGLVYACKVVTFRWDVERYRHKKELAGDPKANGDLKLISRGHLVLRGIGAAVQAIFLGIGVAALLTEEPAKQDVTILGLITTFGLIGAALLIAYGCWYAEHNLEQQISYRRAVAELQGVPAIGDGT